MALDLNNRFQHQPWYIRLWRRRHLIPVPFLALRGWIRCWGLPDNEFRIMWRIAMGDACFKMQWFYTQEEVMNQLRPRKSGEPPS